MVDSRAYVAERTSDEFWLLWWFPPGSDQSEVFRIFDWADVVRTARSLGIALGDLHWAGTSLSQMTLVFGEPPWE
jgi:hypothetical protein